MLKLLLLITARSVLGAGTAITGDLVINEVLPAAFPGLAIHKELGRVLDRSEWRDKALFFPDALAAESVFTVIRA